MWSIQCGFCKHDDEAGRFFTNQLNRFCCPACGTIWCVEQQGKPWVSDGGFLVLPEKSCVVEPQLMLIRS